MTADDKDFWRERFLNEFAYFCENKANILNNATSVRGYCAKLRGEISSCKVDNVKSQFYFLRAFACLQFSCNNLDKRTLVETGKKYIVKSLGPSLRISYKFNRLCVAECRFVSYLFELLSLGVDDVQKMAQMMLHCPPVVQTNNPLVQYDSWLVMYEKVCYNYLLAAYENYKTLNNRPFAIMALELMVTLSNAEYREHARRLLVAERDYARKFFYVYTADDASAVREVLAGLQNELNVGFIQADTECESLELNDATYKRIENAEFVMVFISDDCRNDDFFNGCVTHSLHLNKNIIPIELNSSVHANNKFAFRSKPYCYSKSESKSMLFAQLKMLLGLNIEDGDNFGALVRFVADVDTTVLRDGEELCMVYAKSVNSGCVIRLSKGAHRLEFVECGKPFRRYSNTYKVADVSDEQTFVIDMKGRGKTECKIQSDKTNYLEVLLWVLSPFLLMGVVILLAFLDIL
jgi:hypothetical protein